MDSQFTVILSNTLNMKLIYNNSFHKTLCATDSIAVSANYHSFSAFIRRCDVTDDGKAQADVALADATNDACNNEHCEVM